MPERPEKYGTRGRKEGDGTPRSVTKNAVRGVRGREVLAGKNLYDSTLKEDERKGKEKGAFF